MSNSHFDAAVQNIAKANGEAAAVMQAIGSLAQAQATLALAHEQRTANLIAFTATCDANKESSKGAFRQAADRLGLGDTK